MNTFINVLKFFFSKLVSKTNQIAPYIKIFLGGMSPNPSSKCPTFPKITPPPPEIKSRYATDVYQ